MFSGPFPLPWSFCIRENKSKIVANVFVAKPSFYFRLIKFFFSRNFGKGWRETDYYFRGLYNIQAVDRTPILGKKEGDAENGK